MSEPIRKLYADPARTKVRAYRVVVDLPRDPAAGSRKQLTRTFTTFREARAWLATTRADIDKGTFVAQERTSLAEHLESWLAGRTDVKPTTVANYKDALQVPIRTLGAKALQEITKADLDRMVAGMLDGSLRRVGRKGQPLSPRAVRLTLTVISMALDGAMAEGRLNRNVARLVARPRQARTTKTIWESLEAAAFLAVADQDRLAGAWRVSLHGLRRGETLALSWADVDLDLGVVRVHRSRVLVSGQVIEQDTKSVAGERLVPLSPDAVTSLRRMKAMPAQDRLAAGAAYQDTGKVVVDPLGRPVVPRWYADRFKALAKTAGVPVVSLHTARHGYGSHLLDQGVPLPIVSQVMGHASVDITAGVYAHALKAGADDRVRAALVAAGL